MDMSDGEATPRLTWIKMDGGLWSYYDCKKEYQYILLKVSSMIKLQIYKQEIHKAINYYCSNVRTILCHKIMLVGLHSVL